MKNKRYQAAVQDLPDGRLSLEQAAAFVKKHATATFDETIEVHFCLNSDPKKPDQVVRGTVDLPHGSPRKTRIAVFADDFTVQDAAKEAGADITGGLELIEDIRTKKDLDADVAVATPGIMKELAKIAKILGPRGLMPNPRNGTIGENPTDIVKRLRKGSVSFKTDAGGNIHIAAAKASWDTSRIEGNVRAIIDAIQAARPSGIKGEYVSSVSLCSTMGPSAPVTL